MTLKDRERERYGEKDINTCNKGKIDTLFKITFAYVIKQARRHISQQDRFKTGFKIAVRTGL